MPSKRKQLNIRSWSGGRKYNRVKASAGKYNISEEEVEYLLNEASCGGCGSDEKLCIDHDHDTGEVRGVLCNKCNLAVGLLNDDIEVLANLIEYLA